MEADSILAIRYLTNRSVPEAAMVSQPKVVRSMAQLFLGGDLKNL